MFCGIRSPYRARRSYALIDRTERRSDRPADQQGRLPFSTGLIARTIPLILDAVYAAPNPKVFVLSVAHRR